MEIDSSCYNSFNGAQIRDAQELLQQIKTEVLDKNEKVGIILDVGCGSGNVTKIMADFIPHERILSFDIDEEMVTFAQKQNEKEESIEFFVQDIAVPFEQLHPKLQELEGKVDLVWSNRVLHWVLESRRPTAAANIFRLLAPGGRFYGNMTYMANLNESLPESKRVENEKRIKIPTREEQESGWKSMFEVCGLEDVRGQTFSKDWQYTDPSIVEVERHCCHYLRRYLPDDLSMEEKDKVLEELGFPDLWVNVLFSPDGQPPKEDAAKDLKIYYLQFRVVGRKPAQA